MQNHVHHVLQKPRTGNIAILGHVTDDHDRNIGGLGELQQLSSALPHLPHAARCRGQLRVIHGLNTVDNEKLGLHSIGLSQDSIQIRSRHNEQVFVGAGTAQAHSPHSGLLLAFLAAHIKHLHAALTKAQTGIQQNRRFANARRAP